MTAVVPVQTARLDDDLVDVVGTRVLTGIQLIDVSRLSTDAVPLISSGLITVAGQGPKDSNGAGKSSFIAAISLLSADEQWRLASGGSAAAELLFTAEVAAQDGRWSNADRAYVIGVFTQPEAVDRPSEGWDPSSLTVWLRINRKSPYLNVRWHHGLHLPAGPTEADRAGQADTLWNQLSPRNGRQDIHAGRLSRTLYGEHVRCVSFLSTSVRASPAANLLAQPLNELNPARIFDAIATLTGLDRELEEEQSLRSKEHNCRVTVQEAAADLDEWEEQVAQVERSIARRQQARAALARVDHLWRNHTAQHLLEGLAEVESIVAELQRLESEDDECEARLEALADERKLVDDDGELNSRHAQAQAAFNQLDAEDRRRDVQLQGARDKLADLTSRRIRLEDLAREADGRDRETARRELETANEQVRLADQAVGARQGPVADAEAALARAEGGEDLAAAQLRALRDGGVAAAALADLVVLGEDERALWEPRLAPYHHAVVVHARELDRAARLLAGLPGSLVVLADEAGTAVPDRPHTLPATDGEWGLRGFLRTLATRSGSPPTVDAPAGVVVIGGFAEPTTGRAVRVRQAKERLAAVQAELEAAHDAAEGARRALATAQRRARAVDAAEELRALSDEVVQLQERIAGITEQREAAETALRQARDARDAAAAQLLSRRATLENLDRQITGARTRRTEIRDRRVTLSLRRQQVDLDARLAAWNGTADDARLHVLALDGEDQQLTADRWATDACYELDRVVSDSFRGATDEELPREVREITGEARWAKADLAERRDLFPALRRAIGTHLAQTEEHDAHQLQQIERQRRERTADLEAARGGHAEAARAAAAHRSSVSQGIRACLKKVAAEFDRLDRAYGGYGAGLDYPEPEPPAEPDKPWRWTVTPRWRRAEGQRHSPYNLRGNTALMDEKAVKLVCAAALAGGSDRPLLLILDELGRNLGKQHRREAVALFEQIGRDRNITVIGALQDDMERYAIDASGLYIKLRRGSDAQPYNDPPVVVGHDDNAARVELLRQWLSGTRREPSGLLVLEGE